MALGEEGPMCVKSECVVTVFEEKSNKKNGLNGLKKNVA